MNEATLRRLQERMTQEEYKPSESSTKMEDDPAATDCASQQQQTIYTEPTHPSTTAPQEETESERYARQVRKQHELLQQYEQERHSDEVDVDALASDFQQLNRPEGASPVSSLEDDNLWTCESCCHDCPMAHRFCGVCGTSRPENWWCVCGQENSPYHRYCVECGKEEDLGYEDLGLSAEEQARIEETAGRVGVSSHITIPPAGAQEWDDVDDELTFANDSCAEVSHHAPPQKPQQKQEPQEAEKYSAWNCGVCTFQNENPLFMCCEMCGSARPAAAGIDAVLEEDLATKKTSFCSDDASDDSSTKKKEKSYSELVREQQKRLYHQDQQGGHQQQSLPEPETDHELAMIYAQQERIYAQYQQQQQQLNSS